jgi:NAD+ kinase
VSCSSVLVLSHGRVEQTRSVLESLRGVADEQGTLLRFSEEELDKHGLEPSDQVRVEAGEQGLPDLCVVLGGDGTILRALRRFAGTGVPVYAVNFGEVGFLATVDPDEEDAFSRALAGDFEVLTLPALQLELPGDGQQYAINDVSLQRRPGERVASLAYGVGDTEVGSVRCDGLVVATPAGSTGYNLANGGPVLAWGVEGYVVSFIAPHSLTARALVVAPDDELRVHNKGQYAVDLSVDGITVASIAPGEVLTTRFVEAGARLAQLPGSSFYKRLREKFGRLAS